MADERVSGWYMLPGTGEQVRFDVPKVERWLNAHPYASDEETMTEVMKHVIRRKGPKAKRTMLPRR